MNSPQQDEVIVLTPSQENCNLASPSDFTINTTNDSGTPGHGQRGDTQKEFKKLLGVREIEVGK